MYLPFVSTFMLGFLNIVDCSELSRYNISKLSQFFQIGINLPKLVQICFVFTLYKRIKALNIDVFAAPERFLIYIALERLIFRCAANNFRKLYLHLPTYIHKCHLSKDQIISKCLFGVFIFFQKMNKITSHSSKNESIRSFFGRIHSLTICFRN